MRWALGLGALVVKWAEHLVGGMAPDGVVLVNSGGHRAAGLLTGGEAGAAQQLEFQGGSFSPAPSCDRLLVAGFGRRCAPWDVGASTGQQPVTAGARVRTCRCSVFVGSGRHRLVGEMRG